MFRLERSPPGTKSTAPVSKNGMNNLKKGTNVASEKRKHETESYQTTACSNTKSLNGRNVSSSSNRDWSLSPTLREFDMLDKLQYEKKEETEVIDLSSDDSHSELHEEILIDDVDALFEEGLPEKLVTSGSNTVQLRRKVVLEEVGHNDFDLLPEGWTQKMHCGMPVFFHKKSGVYTKTRPFYIGLGSPRNSEVPFSAIPRSQYKRALDLEEKNTDEETPPNKQNPQSDIEMMSAEVECIEGHKANQSLKSPELNDYCKKPSEVGPEVLINGMDKTERDIQSGMGSGITKSDGIDISIFDKIKIEDPIVVEIYNKYNTPSPYRTLLDYLKSQTSVCEIKICHEMTARSEGLKNDSYTMIVDDLKVTVPCQNKGEGKQRSAQAILHLMRPDIKYWGTLLRMNRDMASKDPRHKTQVEEELITLQDNAPKGQPNFAVLEKLQTAMKKLVDARSTKKANFHRDHGLFQYCKWDEKMNRCAKHC